MTRSTSIAVYRQIESEGLLSPVRWDVYKTLFHHGPLTQMETCRLIKGIRQDRTYMPRFAELIRMGVLQEIGEKQCSITGRIVILWDVTNQLPRKLTKIVRKTRKQIEKELDTAVAALKEIRNFNPWMGIKPETIAETALKNMGPDIDGFSL
jgi:hypothetical protein